MSTPDPGTAPVESGTPTPARGVPSPPPPATWGAPDHGAPAVPAQAAASDPAVPPVHVTQVVLTAPNLRVLAGPAATAGIAYAATLVVAVLCTLVLIFADPNSIPGGATARLPFLLASMALFGPLQIGSADGGLGSLSASLILVPLSLTCIALAAAWLWTAIRPQPATTPRQRWLGAVLTGGVLGVGGAILAAVTQQSWVADLDAFSAGVSMGVAPLPTLLGGLVVGTGGAALGHVVRRGGVDLGRLGLRVPRVVHHATVNVMVGAVVPALLFTVIGFVIGIVQIGFPGTIALLLTVLPNLLVYVFTLGGLGGVSVGGELSASGLGYQPGAVTISLFADGISGWWWVAFVLVLLAVAIAGVRGLLAGGRRDWNSAWATPAVLVAATCVAMLLTSIRVGGSGDFGIGAAGLGGSVRITWLTVLVAAVWGLAVEAAERLVAPGVVTLVPALLRLRGVATRLDGASEQVAQPAAVAAAPAELPATTSVSPAVAEAITSPAAPSAAEPEIPTVNRRTAVVVGLGVLGLVVLVGVAAGARAVVANLAFSPSAPVEEYVAAIQAGRVADAFAIADPDVPMSERGLLTDEVYAAVENRPTGGRVTWVDTRGNDAWVTVESKQDGATVTEEFHLTKRGREFLVFDRWVLEAPSIPDVDAMDVVPYGVDSFEVNGVLQTGDARMFRALPGEYTLTLPVSEDAQGLVSSSEVTGTVRSDSYSLHGLSSTDQLAYSLSDDAVSAAERKAADYVSATCAGATTVTVKECDLDIWEFRDDEATDVVWVFGDTTYEASLDSNGMLAVHVSGDATVSYNLPARSFRDAESPTKETTFEFWIWYTFTDGELVQAGVTDYERWNDQAKYRLAGRQVER